MRFTRLSSVTSACVGIHAWSTRAGLHRQCLFGGLRIGLYEPVKGLIVGKDHSGDASLATKVAAGLLTGA